MSETFNATLTPNGLGQCHKCHAPIIVDRHSGWKHAHVKTYKAKCSADCGQISSSHKDTPDEAVEDFYSYP